MLFWMRSAGLAVMLLRSRRHVNEVCVRSVLRYLTSRNTDDISMLPVIALDVSPIRLALARHNAALYGVEERIEFILADFFSFARTLKQRPGRKIDVVFLSPPWGGPSYLSASPSKTPSSSVYPATGDTPEESYADYSLSSVRPVHGAELFKIARGITKNIAYFLPRNASLEELSALVAPGGTSSTESEKIEVEEEWMGSKLKALTCYFGGLVAGQEHMFNA